MANFFYIYEDFGSNRRLKGMYVTQGKADTEAAGDISLMANQGAVNIPDNVSVGWVWDITDSVWREPNFNDQNELNQRKSAARTYHNQLRAWLEGIIAEEPYQNPDYTTIAKKFLAYAHWAGYIVFTNVNGTWSSAQQIAWAFSAIQGTSDITTVLEFYDKAHLLEVDTVPAEACTWTDPETAISVKLEEARGASMNSGAGYFAGEETDLFVAGVVLSDGAWIEELT